MDDLNQLQTLLLLGIVQSIVTGVFGLIVYLLNKPKQAAEIQQTSATALQIEAGAFKELTSTFTDSTVKFTEMIAKMTIERSDLMGQVQSLERAMSSLERKILDMKKKHDEEIALLQKKHEDYVDSVRKELKLNHDNEIGILKENHRLQMETLKQQLDQVSNERQAAQLRITDLEGKVTELEQLAGLEKKPDAVVVPATSPVAN